MPYGIDKDIGGDSPENVKWMERCVKRVTGQKDKNGKEIPKDRAIAICKSTLQKTKGNAADAERVIDFFLDFS